MKLGAEPFGRGDVCGDACAKKTANEGEEPKLARGEPALGRIAAEAFGVTPSHEVARAWGVSRLDKKLAVGANGLKTMVLDDSGFARKKTEYERCKCRPGHMHDIGCANQAPKLREARLTNHAER